MKTYNEILATARRFRFWHTLQWFGLGFALGVIYMAVLWQLPIP